MNMDYLVCLETFAINNIKEIVGLLAVGIAFTIGIMTIK